MAGKNGFFRKKSALISIGIIVFLLMVAAGFLAGKYYAEKKYDAAGKKMENHEIGYRYISPLLECENYNPLSYNYSSLEKDIRKAINLHVSEHEVDLVSLYFRDLNNGPWIEINGENLFSPASLLKVPLMMAYFNLAEKDKNILNKELVVGNYKTEALQNIQPLKSVKVGQEYKVEELISYMIKYSDNTAANALLSNISGKDLEEIYADFNLKIPGSQGMENYMSVADYSSFFRILYNASYLDREMSEKALKLLISSVFTEGIVAGLPEGIETAHKFGERVFENKKQLHDCGIIYSPEGNYLLCIMTKGDDFGKMKNTIADISKIVFDDMSSFGKQWKFTDL